MDKATVDLATLAKGDRVAWLESGGWGVTTVNMATVQRLTRTQFVVDSDGGVTYRFKRDTGQMMGTRGWGVHLQDPLNGRIVNVRAAVRAREALRAIEALGKPKMPDASTALGVRVQAWKEVKDATAEIEALLAEMDAEQAKRKVSE